MVSELIQKLAAELLAGLHLNVQGRKLLRGIDKGATSRLEAFARFLSCKELR